VIAGNEIVIPSLNALFSKTLEELLQKGGQFEKNRPMRFDMNNPKGIMQVSLAETRVRVVDHGPDGYGIANQPA